MSTKTAINYKISVKKTKDRTYPFEVSLYIERASSKFLRLGEGGWSPGVLTAYSSSGIAETRINVYNCIFPTTVGKAVKTTATCKALTKKSALAYADKLQAAIRTRAGRIK